MLALFGNFVPNPILLNLGSWQVHWYGLLLVAAVLTGLFLAIKLGRRFNVAAESWWDLTFYLVIFGLAGARLWEVFLVSPDYYFTHPAEIIKIWRGGLAIHGALAAGLVTLIIYCYRKKINFWLIADILAPLYAAGQAIGRWGNYFNQELFGRPTDLPWGIYIAPTSRPIEWLKYEYFHPTFLYESLGDLLIFFTLWQLLKKNQTAGRIFWLYLIFYSSLRFVLEFWRIDQEPLLFGWRLPQVVSVAIIITAAAAIYFQPQKCYTLNNKK